MITIEIANFYPNLSFEEEKVRSFFKRIFLLHDHNVSGVLSIAFLNNLAHSKIHGEFLQDFRPTDVITFPADPDNELIGEICVSVDQAIEEAFHRELPFEQELSLYLIHGWLHLVGFDDQNEDDRKIMRSEEANALSVIEKDELWPDFLLAPLSIED